MNQGFEIAPAIDLVLLITVVEGLALLAYHRATGRGVAPRDFLANLIAGLCLMSALRALAHDAGTAWVAICLLAAGIAHASDLWRRWRSRAPATSTRKGAVA